MTSPSDLVGTPLPTRTIPGFTMTQVAWYSKVSGDHNPIHRDCDLAQRVGLADCAVHGMLIAAQFEKAVSLWRDDSELISSSIRFVRPAICNESLVIAGRVAALSTIEKADVVIRLDVRNATRQVVCLADLHVRLGAS